MADDDKLLIKVGLDQNGLDKSLKDATNSVNKSFSEMEKQVKGLDKSLSSLEKARQINLGKPRTEETEKQLKLIENRIDDLTKKKKEIKLGIEKKALLDIDNVATKLAKIAAIGVGVGVAALTTGFLKFNKEITQTAANLDRIDKASQKLSLSTQVFQELDYIASQSGTSVEGLAFSMRTLTNTASEAPKKFQALGISVKDSNGALKNQETLLLETISALQKMPAGTERSRIAFQLLGRSAMELEPLLNSGAGSMEALRKEAHDLGLIMSKEAVQAGVAFGDAMDALNKTMSALKDKILAPLLPTLTEIVKEFSTFISEIDPAQFDNLSKSLEKNKDIIISLGKAVIDFVTKGVPKFIDFGLWVIKNGKTITVVLAGLVGGFIALKIAAFAAGGGFTTLAAQVGATAISFGALNVATGGIIIAVGALVAGITLLILNLTNLKKEIGLYNDESLETGKIAEQNYQSSVKLAREFDILSKKNNKSAQEQKRLNEIAKDLKKIYPELTIEYNKNGEAISYNEKQLKSLNTTSAQTAIQGLEAQKKALLERSKVLEAERITYEKGQEERKRLNLLNTVGAKEATRLFEANRKEFTELANQLTEINGKIKEYTSTIQKSNQVITEKPTTPIGKPEEDKLKALEKLYLGQRANTIATVLDAEEMDKALRDIDKKYYADKLALLEAEAVAIRSLQEPLSAEQIGNLKKLDNQIIETREQLNKLGDDTSFKDKLINAFNEIGQRISDAFAAIADLVGGIGERQTQKLDIEYEKQTKLLDENLKNRLKTLDEANKAENKLAEDKYKQQQKYYDDYLQSLEEKYNKWSEILTENNDTLLADEYERYKLDLENRDATLKEKEQFEADAQLEKEAREEAYRLQTEQADAEAQAKKEQADKDYARKKAEIERKTAIASKASSLFQAGLSLAQGLVAAAGSGALFGLTAPATIALLTSLVATAGAAQIAAIAAKPLPAIPAYATGGIIGNEPNIQQFSKYLNLDSNIAKGDTHLITAQSGEMILNRQQAKEYQNTTNSNVTNNYDIKVMSNAMNPRTVAIEVVKEIRRDK